MRISSVSLLAYVAVVLCGVGVRGGLAQVGADRYAGESIVIVRSESVYAMAADGTGWRQKTMAARVQSEAAVKQLGVLAIPYAGSSERVEIGYARVRRADGTVVETPVADALEMPDAVTREAPFYSDLKQKQLPIRNLRVGDTLEWQAKIVRTKAEAPGEFWGQDGFVEDAVVLEQTIELRVPAGKTVTVWSPGHAAVEKTEGGERVYRWAYSQVKPTTGKEAEAAAEAKKKTVWTAEQEVDFREGRLPGIAWTTFPNWEAVGAWYRGLEGDRMEAAPEVKAKVAELTAGKATEEEKVRAVYGFVATQVRYIGVAFGVGRYQPHRAGEVLENQYGDCKDKHTLLAAMLGALGVKADAVLIGAGMRFNPAVPSPGAFNHLITRAQVGGKTVWLDTTAEVAPYGMLVAVTRDHAALAVPEVGVAKVERTPVELPFKPFQRLDAVGTLDKEGVSESKMTLTLRGDDEVVVRAVLRQIAPAQYEQFVQNLSQGMSFGGTTSHAVLSRAEDTAEPLVIRYDYHREKAGNDWEHYRTLAQFAQITIPVPDEKDPPVREIALGEPRVETSSAAMKLPDGWRAEIPEAVHERSKWATFDQTYRFEKGTLYADRKMEVFARQVPQADWKAYKKFTDVLSAHNDLYVQLIRAKGAVEPAPAKSGTEGVSSDKAAALVSAAFEAFQANDLKLAVEKLDEAKAANSSQVGLWGGYGFAAFRRGELSEAMVDYEKELALHPQEVTMYADMARLEGATGKKKEQIAVLRRWVTTDPGSLPANLGLIQALLAADDGPGAVGTAEAALKNLPETKREDESFQLALGEAKLKGGQKAAGTAILVAVLAKTESAMMLNAAAYELADSGEELTTAESSTRKALQKLGDQSKSWTLDENLQALLGTSAMTIATWDTMGWVLFREGKAVDAEDYLQAAWKNRQDAVVGEHLGDVLTKEGRRADAARVYWLALESVPQTDPLGVRDPKPSKQTVRLSRKLAAAGGHDPADAKERSDAFLELETMQQVPLGANTTHGASAYYKLLVSPAGVERTQATGEQDPSGGTEALKRGAFASYFPKGADARLVFTGRLNCHDAVCEFARQR